MPIYAYCCPKCAAEFDKIVPVADRDAVVCAHCGAPAARELAAPSVTIGGSGVYKPGTF